jgi:hypothetical protein
MFCFREEDGEGGGLGLGFEKEEWIVAMPSSLFRPFAQDARRIS